MQPGERARPPPEMMRPDKQEFRYADFDGPSKNRRCTDILFLLLILLSWAVMTVIGLATTGYITVRRVDKGDPDRLFHGMDYMGNLCGVDDPVKDLKYKWDPNYNHITISSTGDYVPAELGICVDSCPTTLEYRADPYGRYGTWAPLVSTSQVLGFCIPVDASRAVAFAENTVEDFAVVVLLAAVAGFVLSGVLSYLFLVSVRIPCLLRVSVWVSIWVVLLLLAVGAYLTLEKARTEADKEGADAVPEVQINLLKALGTFLAVAAALWLCLVIYLREKIALAISLIYETSKAVTSIPLIMLSPFFNGAIMAAFSFLWLTYCAHLVTSGDIEEVSSNGYEYKEAQVSEEAKKALLFMAFMWLWTVTFIHGASQWICSHTVLSWYFRPSCTSVGSSQLICSTGVFLRYHVGTVAFGSLILTIVQFLRAILLYIKRKLKNKSAFPVKIALCCCSCCLCCLAKCIKFIDKHAYIHSALSGTSFCFSAKRAFGLILRNLGRVATISILSNLVVFVGKISITLCSAGIAYYYMTNYLEDDLNGFVVPTLFIAVIAYMCSSLFLDTVTMTSDTVLQAFLVDEEMKVNDDGAATQRAIRNHHNDSELRSYMHKRQLSNPELFRWNSVENEGRVAVDYGELDGIMPTAPPGDIELRHSREAQSRYQI